jgi:hypothetical protein
MGKATARQKVTNSRGGLPASSKEVATIVTLFRSFDAIKQATFP